MADNVSDVSDVSDVSEVNKILAERPSTHGDFRDNSTISQELKRVMHGKVGWDRLTSFQREALDMIAHKISRILAGNPNFKDHWDDIAGYATLVANRCEQEPNKKRLTVEQTKRLDELRKQARAELSIGNNPDVANRADELLRMGVADLPVIKDGLSPEERQRLARIKDTANSITASDALYCAQCDNCMRVNAAGYCMCGFTGCPNAGKKVV